MMLRQLSILALASVVLAQIPLPSSPNWTSTDDDYSTGGTFADIDGNGWLDLCVSNGNDMDEDRNAVYLNSGGVLETVASWRSQDTGMFGHCYAGDVDNDGRPDLAVAYLGPAYSPPLLPPRVYRNTGTGLDSTPWWQGGELLSSFDCCLGDFDLDGDLDLVVSAGNAYTHSGDSVRIYRNDNGVLDSIPCWRAHDSIPSDAVRFCDIDDDGDLDLFVGQHGRVVMYRNNSGTLETSPSWSFRAGWVLRLAFGDYDQDGLPDLAVASNGQIGDPNSVKVLRNDGGTLDTIAAATLLANEDYSSCVAWGDVDGDGWPELAAGGWWEPLVVFDNDSGTIGAAPSWSWYAGRLVCETVAWADVDNSHLAARVDRFSGDGVRRLFSFARPPVQWLDSVRVDRVTLPPSDWCWDPLAGWLSFGRVPAPGTDNIELFYRCSDRLDLCVTNWEPDPGNHVFLNTASGTAEPPGRQSRPLLVAAPNLGTGPFRVKCHAGAGGDLLRVFREDGRLIRSLNPTSRAGGLDWTWDGLDSGNRPAAAGVYFCSVTGLEPLKLVLRR